MRYEVQRSYENFTVLIYDHQHFVGRLYTEVVGDCWTPHYSIYDDKYKRQGCMSAAMDIMMSKMMDKKLIWSAAIGYRGNGICTPEGRAFAKAYSLKHGLPEPHWME